MSGPQPVTEAILDRVDASELPNPFKVSDMRVEAVDEPEGLRSHTLRIFDEDTGETLFHVPSHVAIDRDLFRVWLDGYATGAAYGHALAVERVRKALGVVD